mgnify:CR=1 FL=1
MESRFRQMRHDRRHSRRGGEETAGGYWARRPTFGGALAGLGGGYLSLIRVPQWTEGMTAGAGWIALAIVVFSIWRPWRLILGAYIFGGITILQLNLQAIGVNVDVALLSMTPYAVTIVVLILMSLNISKKSLGAPGSLGKSFIKVV